MTSSLCEAQKAKRVLTGKEAELFDSWIKMKDGTEYGPGASPEDLSKLVWIIIANGVAWLGMLGFKIWDRLTGKGDQLARDMREMKEAILRLDSNSRHWVTDKDVDAKVKETIRFLKEHKGMF